MKNAVNRAALVLIAVFVTQFSFAQKNKKAQLEKEQKQIENRISNTKKLLSKTENDLRNRTVELQMIERNLNLREQLVRNLDQQIRSTEQRINELELSMLQLNTKTAALKRQYSEMVVYAYKNRGSLNKLMFVFSSDNFNQAMKRATYLEKINEVRTRQVQLIRSNQEQMEIEQKELEKARLNAVQLAETKKQERATLMEDKEKQQVVFNAVKAEEATLRARLADDERKKIQVQNKIQQAIEQEMAEERERERKKRAVDDRRRKEELARQNNQNPGTKPNETKPNEVKPDKPATTTKPDDFGLTPEAKLVGNNFAANKGRLPYPVGVGTIVERFGRNAHPTISNVYTDNNGIDISTNRGAEVRAVFEGEVSSVITIPGAGKAVILSHGNYKTVYANLQDVYVSKGAKVGHKHLLGSLLPQGNISILHFEIHVINGNSPQKLNPELWLSK
jgi:septal ring factor EnvC (AmiA/AmiB activator)